MCRYLILTFLLLTRSGLWAGVTIYPMQCHTIKCDNTPALMTNITCKLERPNPGLALLTLAGSLPQETNDVSFNLQANLKKNNIYVSKLTANNLDVCEFTSGSTNMFFEQLFPHSRKTLQNVLMPCPYKGRIELKNYELRGNVVAKFLPSGYYRFDFALKNSQNENYIGFKLFCIINKRLVKDPKP